MECEESTVRLVMIAIGSQYICLFVDYFVCGGMMTLTQRRFLTMSDRYFNFVRIYVTV